MTTPIPNCPQPETPIRDRAWTNGQIMALECISDKIRKGEPVSFFEAIAAINYQKDLREKREANRWHRQFWRWCKSAIGATP